MVEAIENGGRRRAWRAGGGGGDGGWRDRGRLFRAGTRRISSCDKTGRTSGGRCEFRMDVTAIRTSLCDHGAESARPVCIDVHSRPTLSLSRRRGTRLCRSLSL